MDQRLQEYKDEDDANCKKLATRLDRLETNWRRTPDPLEENESQTNKGSPRRRQAYPSYTEDTDAQYVKSVKVDGPIFDGRPDSQACWSLEGVKRDKTKLCLIQLYKKFVPLVEPKYLEKLQ